MILELEILKSEIKKGVKNTFSRLIESHPNIYSYALYSDENCETLRCVANTTEYYKQKSLNDEGGSDNYYKYSTDEWDFSLTDDIDELEFNNISKLLYKNSDIYDFENTEDEIKFDKFQQAFYAVCIDVLKELNIEKFFQEVFPKDVFILFSASEYEFEMSVEKEMTRALNYNKYGDEYIKWMESWS